MDTNRQIEKKHSKVPVVILSYRFNHLIGDIRENSYRNRYYIDLFIDENNATGYYGSGKPEMKKIGEAMVILYNWERASRYNDVWCVGGIGTNDDSLISVFIDVKEGRVKPEWEEEFSICGSRNILYIENISLKPEYRHQALGAYVIKSIVDTFNGQCGIVMIYPIPMQKILDVDTFTEWDPEEVGEFGNDFQKGVDRLVQYYELLGFKKCVEEDVLMPSYMYLNTYKENPLLDKIDIYVYWDY